MNTQNNFIDNLIFEIKQKNNWKRIAAYALDLFTFFIIGYLITSGFATEYKKLNIEPIWSFFLAIFSVLFWFFVYWFYYPLKTNGKTFWKTVFKCGVKYNTKFTLKNIFYREFLKFGLTSLTFGAYIPLNFIYLCASKKRKSLHETFLWIDNESYDANSKDMVNYENGKMANKYIGVSKKIKKSELKK